MLASRGHLHLRSCVRHCAPSGLHSHVVKNSRLTLRKSCFKPQAIGPNGARAPAPAHSSGRLMEKIAAAIEADDSVHRFETVAGRAAMMGFVAAALAEFVLPAHGLFGGWSGEQLSAFSSAALVGVTCAALLAMASKRKVGTRLTEAVFASLTALSRSAGSLSLTSVDEAVDSIFSSVFTDEIIREYTEDEFI